MTDYKYSTVYTFDPTGPAHNELQETSKNLVLKDMLRYPNNSLNHKTVYTNFFNNLHRIPLKELEELVDKYKV